MRGKASNKRGQAQRDWHRLQVERMMSRSAAAPKERQRRVREVREVRDPTRV
jgi:hypothetical protein